MEDDNNEVVEEAPLPNFILQNNLLRPRPQEGLKKTDILSVEIDKNNLVQAMSGLKEKDGYLMLLDITSVDWLDSGKMELFYELYSLSQNSRLRVCVEVDRVEPVAPSVSGVWACAEFQEREVLDLMGIKFSGHPDLRRLFLDDDWDGYPLKKDYKDDFMLELPDYVK